jgi:hypothetical protein
MDVYHKLLSKLYEISGGRDSTDVDFIALLKREGFFSNLDGIKAYMSGESWITDSPKPNHVRITHWGVIEAKKGSNPSSTDSKGDSKKINRLLAESHELNAMMEKFAAIPSDEGFKKIQKKLAEMSVLADEIEGGL